MRLVNRAENWEKVYEAFQQINFAAWDFNSIKESLLDYLKLTYPEDFNNFIESDSGIIPVLELFAYVGELLAYRLDVNAHENFISTAQRKESVLRLAKLLSYKASRNIPARGLVKLTSVSTSETVFDSRGLNLANRTIRWNDQNNPNWKEQFIIVMNKVIDQEFGSVLPSDRIQVQDVLFEVYTLINNPIKNNVVTYSVSISGENHPMELVASRLNTFGPYERRPERDMPLSVLYLSDGLGDSSENTGFFFLTKQGVLGKSTADFDGVTPNQTYDVIVANCNETDVWVNNINADSGHIIESSDSTNETRVGEWEQVDVSNAQNIIFNTNPHRAKYEVETLANDNFRIIFGDGKFATIPSGRFDIWYRVSANTDIVIPTNAIQETGASLTYSDGVRREHTFSFTFSLVSPIQNSAPSEDIERIRRIAPSVYYTQDRMVNGRDYNEFMLQDNTILKLRSINRTFAGDSKYISWHDPNEYYDNVKIFGDDGVVYFHSAITTTRVLDSALPDDTSLLVSTLISNHIEPLFSEEPHFIRLMLDGSHFTSVRKTFTGDERVVLGNYLTNLSIARPNTIHLSYSVSGDAWTTSFIEPTDWWISITANADSWDIRFNGKRIVVHSDDVKFWVTNGTSNVIEYDTLNPVFDEIVILNANVDWEGYMLSSHYRLRILRQEIIEAGENLGLDSIHDLHTIPVDENNDGYPDNVLLDYLIGDTSFVYFNRESVSEPWVFVPESSETVASYEQDVIDGTGLWKRERGRERVNFLWMHRTPRYHLIDPSASNIIDTFIIPRGYYTAVRLWLNGNAPHKPIAPTPFQLRSDYSYLLDNKMISDTVVLHPGKFKILFGQHAPEQMKATFKVIRSNNKTLTSNQIKTIIVDSIIKFFDVNHWEFGETFYFTELAAYIHSRLPADIDSIVLVPKHANNVFGDLFQVFCKEDEIIQPSISVNDIEIVESLTPKNLKQSL